MMMTCSCCQGRFSAFTPFGVIPRANAQCPGCGSLERHRLLWLYLQERTNLLHAEHTVLHLAPEAVMAEIFRKLPNVRYLSGDLDPADETGAMVALDVTALPCRDDAIDVIICSHVLEHVADDHQAMTELRRVLSPTGWAIIQSPLDSSLERTLEDPTVVDPAERERLFGQRDHVRQYGRDYGSRLERAGFTLRIDAFAASLDPAAVREYGLLPEDLYVCRKPPVSEGEKG